MERPNIASELCAKIEREMALLTQSTKYTTYRFHPTRKYTEANVQVIEQLPETFNYPRRKKNITINKSGIKIDNIEYSWRNIALTGIKTWGGDADYGPATRTALLVGLDNGRVIEVELRPTLFDYGISDFESIVEIYKKHHK